MKTLKKGLQSRSVLLVMERAKGEKTRRITTLMCLKTLKKRKKISQFARLTL